MKSVILLAVFAVLPEQVAPLEHVASLNEMLRSPARVAVSSDGQVLVTDPSRRQIVRFDALGNLLGSWPVPERPIGLAVHPDGRYFVSYRDEPGVGIYDSTFTRIGLLGEGQPLVAFTRPTDIDVATDTGRIYVVDSGADRIYGFESTGGLALIFGTHGEGLGQFQYPSAIAVDEERSRLLVADQDNFRVQVFSTSGLLLGRFGFRNKYLPSGGQEGWLPRTQGIAVDDQGYIYLADALMNTVRIFAPNGMELGKVIEHGQAAGAVRTPCDLALSPDGQRLYVASTNTSTVEIFATPTLPAPRGMSIEIVGDGHTAGTNDSAHDTEFRRTKEARGVTKEKGLRPSHAEPSHVDSLADSGHTPIAGFAVLSSYEGPHMINATVICGRCHGIAGQPGGNPATLEGQITLCMSCHSSGGQAMSTPLNAADIIHGNDGPGRSHPWGVPAVNEDFGSTGPHAGGDMAAYLASGGLIKCGTCHDQHSNDAGSPYLRVRNTRGSMCKECHTGRSDHTPDSAWQPNCNECHAPHDSSSYNLSLIATSVENRTLDMMMPVVFTARTGPGSFDDGNPASNDGICQVCHTATAYHRYDGSSAGHHGGSDCTACHPHEDGFLATGGACDACHGAPPATGAHLAHFGGTAEDANYGGVENLSLPASHVFQCGNCHPHASSRHLNGTVEIELYYPGAPPDSLKGRNPATAEYTPGPVAHTDVNGIPYSLGSCSNVYCHSQTVWSSPTPISAPLVDSGTGFPILDANGNLTYDPYSVTESRDYAVVSWGDSALGCNACHRNNPQTSFPDVRAGVGNSHGWIDDFGYEDLHAWNMGFDPLTCRVCHFATVQDEMTWVRDAQDITHFDDAPIADRSIHVNGAIEVVFDPVNPVVYPATGRTYEYNLATAAYDPSSKTCSNVGCHLNQAAPEWGKPYRWWDPFECDQCHQYGGPWPRGSSEIVLEQPTMHFDPIELEKSASSGDPAICTRCHQGHTLRRDQDPAPVRKETRSTLRDER
ncbi:MAG: SMP-30/gluconolactonase/LRE family protein [Phycisphaerae bacterium]|nr:SMP-30/gluconolactonase/LRE family protein [Phycisphaerae bacterium]